MGATTIIVLHAEPPDGDGTSPGGANIASCSAHCARAASNNGDHVAIQIQIDEPSPTSDDLERLDTSSIGSDDDDELAAIEEDEEEEDYAFDDEDEDEPPVPSNEQLSGTPTSPKASRLSMKKEQLKRFFASRFSPSFSSSVDSNTSPVPTVGGAGPSSSSQGRKSADHELTQHPHHHPHHQPPGMMARSSSFQTGTTIISSSNSSGSNTAAANGTTTDDHDEHGRKSAEARYKRSSITGVFGFKSPLSKFYEETHL